MFLAWSEKGAQRRLVLITGRFLARARSPTYAVVRVIYLGVAEPMVGHNSPLAPNDSLITRPAAAAVAAKLLGAK